MCQFTLRRINNLITNDLCNIWELVGIFLFLTGMASALFCPNYRQLSLQKRIKYVLTHNSYHIQLTGDHMYQCDFSGNSRVLHFHFKSTSHYNTCIPTVQYFSISGMSLSNTDIIFFLFYCNRQHRQHCQSQMTFFPVPKTNTQHCFLNNLIKITN